MTASRKTINRRRAVAVVIAGVLLALANIAIVNSDPSYRQRPAQECDGMTLAQWEACKTARRNRERASD